MGQGIASGSAVGRVAVITGGASGIGLAAGRRCAAMGMKVVLSDINVAEMSAACASIRSEVPSAVVVGIHCDVSKQSSVDSLKDQVYSNPDLGEVGFLFANAGMTRAASGSVMECSMEDWERVFAVNVYGVVHCLKSFVPAMQAQRMDSAVVTTSSYAGLLNASPGGFGSDVCYTASKHAVTIITEALAHDLRLLPSNRVSVHCLFPAGVKTNFLRKAEEASLQGLGEGPERARKQASMATSPTSLLITRNGLSPEELVQVLYDGMNDGKFYIRAYDHQSSFDGLGAAIMERARDIVDQRDPISLEHPERSKRASAIRGMKEALASKLRAKL